ncbi:WOR3 White-opaque regulator 3 [Candida maltosa Xu316]
MFTSEDQQMVRSNCTRCKKEFDQPVIIPKMNDSNSANGSKILAEPKIFKLCQHCRDLQRQRSRRWQKKTKDKQGVCRRCGTEIPLEERKFVLCPNCRQNLRTRKANRAAQGKCVHCSGPLDASILVKDPVNGGDLESNGGEKRVGRPSSTSSYKVCQRCRENDRIRRLNLEKMGNCNRCAKALDPSDYGRNKVCATCRTKKKKNSNSPPDSNTTSPLYNGGYQQQPQSLPIAHHLNNNTQPPPQDQMNINNSGSPITGTTADQHHHYQQQQQQQYSSVPVPVQQHHYVPSYIPIPSNQYPHHVAPPPPPSIHQHPPQHPPLQINQYQGLQQYTHTHPPPLQPQPIAPPSIQHQQNQNQTNNQGQHQQEYQNGYSGTT